MKVEFYFFDFHEQFKSTSDSETYTNYTDISCKDKIMMVLDSRLINRNSNEKMSIKEKISSLMAKTLHPTFNLTQYRETYLHITVENFSGWEFNFAEHRTKVKFSLD